MQEAAYEFPRTRLSGTLWVNNDNRKGRSPVGPRPMSEGLPRWLDALC
jgi:hypothetical protein